jgi:hypothetical protein
MGPLDAVWHLLNFFAPALGVGLLAALAAKLLWRRELGAVRWQRLAGFAGAAGAVVSIGGLIVFGRDGRMATYAMLVVASAVALWWTGFGPGRR